MNIGVHTNPMLVTGLELMKRAFHGVLQLERSIGELRGEERILPAHLAEALQYRPRRWD